MILEKIEKDINTEFTKIRKIIKQNYLSSKDLSSTKNNLKTFLPQDVKNKAKLLAENFVNYLMEEAKNEIKNQDIAIQNKFFEKDFRKKIQKWIDETENSLNNMQKNIDFSFDPRIKEGAIKGGGTFVALELLQTILPASLKETLLLNTLKGTLIYGFATIIVSGIVFKLAFDKATDKSKTKILQDIDIYLKANKDYLLNWFNTIKDNFDKEFENFCKENNVNGEKQ